MRNRLFFALIIFCFFANMTVADELTPEKAADIRLLMETTGAADVGLQMTNAIMPVLSTTLKSKYPQIPDSTIIKIQKKISDFIAVKAKSSGGIADQIIPIYSRHFTHADIKELLAFYKTDIGKKIIKELPLVMSESIATGQKWGQSLGPDIDAIITGTLKEDGIKM